MFHNNVYLKHIDASLNNIGGIEQGLFHYNGMLEHIKLSHNNIAEVSE